MPEKLRVLFLGMGNSCRSQMAEALVNHLKGDLIETCSAGIEKWEVDPLAIQAMAEIGIDISAQKSKLIEDLDDLDFDYAVTVCDYIKESCVTVPGIGVTIQVDLDYPPALAEKETSPERRLDHYRRVRDKIKDFVESLPESLLKY
jgi:arsenate reductase (thioredoxin)